jgi:putative transposase
VAAHKRTALDLGAWLCFEDEAGQSLRPPKATTWAPRGLCGAKTVNAVAELGIRRAIRQLCGTR